MTVIRLPLPLKQLWPLRSAEPGMPGARLMLGQFQRNLLFAGTGLLSLLMLLGLGLMIGFQIDRYHSQRLDDFVRTRLALEQHLGQHEVAQARLANMAEFAWNHQSSSPLARAEPLRDRFVREGEHLLVTDEAGEGGRTALGMGTAQWNPAVLERYLQLSRSLSLIGRITGDDDTPADTAYFFDPSGRFLSLHPGVDKSSLQRSLGVMDRQALFNHLRRHALLPTPRSSQDQIPALRGVGENDRPQMSFGPHPLTRTPSLVTTFYARDRSHPIGVFVAFEPISRLEQVLQRSSSGRVALVGQDGVAVASTDGAGLPPQSALRELVAQARSSTSTTTLRRDGHVMLGSSVPGTRWDLVESYSWRDVLADGRHLLGVGSLLILGSLVTLWILVLRLNRRWFRPALDQLDHMQARESLSRTVVEQSPTALCLLVPGQLMPRLANPAMQRLIEQTGHEGVRLLDCLRAGHAQQRLGTERASADWFPLTIHAADGGAPRHLRVQAVDTQGAEEGGVLFSVHDVTGLFDRELEQQQARELAEAESLAKSAFLATVSHEIRTPLYGILGHLELLDRPGLDAAQRMRIQRIRQSADSLLDIIRDVLDLSRMEFEPLEAEPVVFEPEALLERVALLFAPLAYAKGVDLDYSIDASVAPHLCGQEEQIERILRNLASNAVKFTSSGRIELRLRQEMRDGQPWLCSEVADSGIGLSAEQQARLFRPFAQADDSIRGRFGGSGLGLFLCRQLCDSMGGSIRVKSTQGVGTLFTFEVPIGEAHSQVVASPLAGHCVLLLSPSPIWRAELGRRLRSWGAQVHELEHATELERLDAPADIPLVTFERGEARLQARTASADGRLTVRVRVDGPLRPAAGEGGWVLSAYAGEALLRILQATLLPAGGAFGPLLGDELESSQLVRS